MTFWSYRENGLIRKIRLISKFTTSQPGSHTIAMHILSNISRRKDNQTMKLGQIIIEIFFFRNYPENEAGRLVPDLFFFLTKG